MWVSDFERALSGAVNSVRCSVKVLNWLRLRVRGELSSVIFAQICDRALKSLQGHSRFGVATGWDNAQHFRNRSEKSGTPVADEDLPCSALRSDHCRRRCRSPSHPADQSPSDERWRFCRRMWSGRPRYRCALRVWARRWVGRAAPVAVPRLAAASRAAADSFARNGRVEVFDLTDFSPAEEDGSTQFDSGGIVKVDLVDDQRDETIPAHRA
jgi:hypothetical protein